MDIQILTERLGLQEIKKIDVDYRSPVVFLEKLLPALKAQPASRPLDTITNVVVHSWDYQFLRNTLLTIHDSVNQTVPHYLDL